MVAPQASWEVDDSGVSGTPEREIGEHEWVFRKSDRAFP